MRFPNISDICTKNVDTIAETASLRKAIDQMVSSEHRSLVVIGGHYRHILLVQDVLRFNYSEADWNRPLSEMKLARMPIIQSDANVLDSIQFLKEKIEYIGVEADDGSLYGILTHTDIVNSIDPEILMESYSISDVIKKHRQELWVNETESTEAVIAKMVAHGSDCVLAVTESRAVKGIFTTKDVLKLYEDQGDISLPLSNYMSTPVETITQDMTVKAAVNFVKSKPFKRVVVVDKEGLLEGMVLQSELIGMTYNKWADLMRQFQDELQELNSLLEVKSQKYEELASQDALTGLYNRYKFTEVFTTELLTMQRRHNDMSLIMLDIDYFKKINDTYGHNKGDEVLVAVSKLILEHQRKVDVVCRWGGEEFLILLPTANSEQAVLIAEQIKLKIKALTLFENHQVTASFGVSQVRPEDSLETLVGRADEALYQAKINGRDRVVLG